MGIIIFVFLTCCLEIFFIYKDALSLYEFKKLHPTINEMPPIADALWEYESRCMMSPPDKVRLQNKFSRRTRAGTKDDKHI